MSLGVSSRAGSLLLSASLIVLAGAAACESSPPQIKVMADTGGAGAAGGASADESGGGPANTAGQPPLTAGGATNGGADEGGAGEGGATNGGAANGGATNGGADEGGATNTTGGVNVGGAGAANAGSATAGGTTAGGGGSALESCPLPPAAGTISDLLIDNLEDGDNGLAHVGSRTGLWYTYVDTLGSTIVPAPDPAGASPSKAGSTNCHGGMTCMLVSGNTVMADNNGIKYPYAGVGFDFSHAKKPCVYNGSAYSGIRFWARGDVAITIKLNTAATTTPDGGGTCISGLCGAGFSPTGADVLLTPTWQQIDVNFATAAPPSWAEALALHPDPATLVSLQVQVPPGQEFNVALDDFTFY
jgi:hypothetical protein